MSRGKLTTTSFVVLGMIGLRGPSTPYELKRAVAGSVGHFWSFPHVQLYREPARLAEAGFLREDREEWGRRRRIYSLSEAGEEALRTWLQESVTEAYELRDLAMLKLFYSELGTRDAIVMLAHDQVAVHKERLALYESMAARYESREEFRTRRTPLAFGIRLERDEIQFWEEIAAHPPVADTLESVTAAGSSSRASSS